MSVLEVRVRNCFAYIEQIEDKNVRALSDVCSFFVQGAQFTPAYSKGHWDGRRRLLDTKKMRFPTGLLTSVKESKIFSKIKIIDERKKPDQIADIPEWRYPHPLRDYQEQAVKDALAMERGVIDSSTGSGKTVIAFRIAFELKAKTLFVVNTREAMIDTLKRAEECFPGSTKNGTIAEFSGRSKGEGSFITIATMGALIAEFKRFQDNGVKPIYETGYGLLLADEVHHAGAETWSNVLLGTNAYYRFGLTGTPFRTDNAKKLLWATTGRIITSIKAKHLQGQGHLAECDITFVEVDHPRELDTPLRFAEAYEAGIVRNNYRNHLVCEIVKHHIGDSKIIIVDKIAHGEALLELVQKIDKDAVFIQSGTKKRDLYKEEFASGKRKTVIATKIYNESVDVPIAKVLINAAGGQSDIQQSQRLGRILRKHQGKDKSYYYDFLDLFNSVLMGHSIGRKATFLNEGHTVRFFEIEDPDALYTKVTGERPKERFTGISVEDIFA